jgi:hypothetical protein
MAIDTKYGRVTTERGTIGEDEPVVVFRAQDELLPKVLAYYHQLCLEEGSPRHHLDGIIMTGGIDQLIAAGIEERHWFDPDVRAVFRPAWTTTPPGASRSRWRA